MEALYQTASNLNDVNSPEVIEKANAYRKDPHTAKIKSEYVFFLYFHISFSLKMTKTS
jgi:hypothetical protein